MSTIDDIDKAVEIFNKNGCPFVLMHTVSTYPCRNDDCNLLMIKTLQNRYDVNVGYSGHEVGVYPSIYAALLGAVAIERHITLDRAMYGSDQAASLEKKGLELLVRECRSLKSVMGKGEKIISNNEVIIAKKLRYFLGN
jgi:N-acetylneuraminate synthase